MGKFHYNDGLYFERIADGSVRVTRADSFEDDGEELFTVDCNSWASIVASVSEGGEHDGRFFEALRFHGEPENAEPKMLA